MNIIIESDGQASLSLGVTEKCKDMLLLRDGHVVLPDCRYGNGERFRCQVGTTAYWCKGGDGAHVHAATDWADYQYVFLYRENCWWQRGTLVPVASRGLPSDAFPQLSTLQLRDGGLVTIEGADYGTSEDVNVRTSDGLRIRKLDGTDSPIVAVLPDDDYVGVVFRNGAWLLFSPRIPLSERSPWRRLPSISWEPNVIPEIPGLTLSDGGKYVVGNRGLSASDDAPLIFCHAMYRYEKGRGGGAPLRIKPLDGEQEWQFLYTDGEWTVRAEWIRIVKETMVEGVLRFGEKFIQHIPRKSTYGPDEELSIGELGGASIRKPWGDRELLILTTDRGRSLFLHHDRSWFMLATNGQRPYLTRPHDIAPPPKPPRRDFVSFACHLLRLHFVAALPGCRRLAYAGSRLARIRQQETVWVPSSDPRFGGVQSGVVTALEPLAASGLGLYHDGRVRVGRDIFQEGQEIDLNFGTALVLRHASTSVVFVREFSKCWSEIRLRRFAGRWERHVNRTDRDNAEAIVFDLLDLAQRQIRSCRRWLSAVYLRYRHYQGDR